MALRHCWIETPIVLIILCRSLCSKNYSKKCVELGGDTFWGSSFQIWRYTKWTSSWNGWSARKIFIFVIFIQGNIKDIWDTRLLIYNYHEYSSLLGPIPPCLWSANLPSIMFIGVLCPLFYGRSLTHIAPFPESRAQIAFDVPHLKHEICPQRCSAGRNASSRCLWSRWPPPWCSPSCWLACSTSSLGSLPGRWSSVA